MRKKATLNRYVLDMLQENKIFKIQTICYKIVSEILKGEKIEIFKVFKGSLPNQFIFIESVREEFISGDCSQFLISLVFVSESSKISEIGGYMESIKANFCQDIFASEMQEEIINFKLFQNSIKNFSNSIKVEGRMEYICFLP